MATFLGRRSALAWTSLGNVSLPAINSGTSIHIPPRRRATCLYPAGRRRDRSGRKTFRQVKRCRFRRAFAPPLTKAPKDPFWLIFGAQRGVFTPSASTELRTGVGRHSRRVLPPIRQRRHRLVPWEPSM